MAKINVHVQPGASRNEILGLAGDVLRVRIMAPPVEGKANEALIAFLAKTLRVRRNAVTVLRGASGRDKLMSVEGLDDEEVRRRLISSSKPGD